MIIDFITPGDPIAQPRPRAKVEKFGWGRTAKFFARIYDCEKDDPVIEYKKAVASSAIEKLGKDMEPLTCPIGVDIEFVMPRPKSLIWVKKPMPRCPCRDVPDIDNLAKAVLDALSKLVWRDDRQIFFLRVYKWYAAGDETPHTRVKIKTTTEEVEDEQRPDQTAGVEGSKGSAP
jgi:Holliday junction resolvase RusA-like endonuclease